MAIAESFLRVRARSATSAFSCRTPAGDACTGERATLLALGATLALCFASSAGGQQAFESETLFKSRCASCHEPPIERAPSRAQLAARTAAEITESLTHGLMAPMATGLSPGEVQALATFLTATPAPAASGQPASLVFAPTVADVFCAQHRRISAPPGSWSSWGLDERNSRFQRRPGLAIADVHKLKVKWAFSYRGPTYGQPTVLGDHLFITSRSGSFYALDASSGCVRWKVENIVARATPVVIRSRAAHSGWMVFVADSARVVHAFDADNGKEIWRTEPLETHPVSAITGSPAFYGGRLFVGFSSGEEGVGASPTYSCCTFRGSLVSLDARTGKVQWRRYVIDEPLRPIRRNAQGVQLQGPAGGGVWSAPTIDVKRGQVLIGTGNSYIDAPTTGTDAVIAFDMGTGRERWRAQVTPNDNYLVACNRVTRTANCADDSGPDFDFGAPPILTKLANGKDILLAGQKSGQVSGLDPDTGRIVWQAKVGAGSSLGGIEWGMAADDRYLYVPNSDLIGLIDEQIRAGGRRYLIDRFIELYTPAKPGLTALDPATGQVLWHVAAQKSPCQWYGDRASDRAVGCFPAHSAAVTVIPGVLFSGSTDGWFRAYDTRNGEVLWAFNTTAQTYDTINGVKGQPGGSIDAMGPTVANGMVFTMAGYNGTAGTGGNGTNVLLAFSVDGK